MHLFVEKVTFYWLFSYWIFISFLNLGQSTDVSLSFLKIQNEAGFCLTALIDWQVL